MSDEIIPGEPKPDSAPKETPKVRRVSNKLPRKSAKKAAQQIDDSPEVPTEEFESGASEASETSGDPKRKNRRRRSGKGKALGDDSEKNAEEIEVIEESVAEKPEIRTPRQPQQNQRPPQNQRVRPDPEKVAKNAWKIFLAEVSEEGVALIGDNDARELARRCFRLSEIFLEEETRRL